VSSKAKTFDGHDRSPFPRLAKPNVLGSRCRNRRGPVCVSRHCFARVALSDQHFAPLVDDSELPVDPVSGGNRELCDSSNAHESAFGISEMTDDKTIR
jgi:hypothetical protein